MREVAKSMLGFSWAVSLFSLEQMSKLLVPSTEKGATAALEFDEVSRVVQSRLSEPAAQQFRAGDDWQRRLVDVLFDAASLESLDPRRMVQAGVDVMKHSVSAVRQSVEPTGSERATAQ
jgi:hypothetical protein